MPEMSEADIENLRRMFRQKHPCSDCPFLKEGGVRHGIDQAMQYAAYFMLNPGVTFPCHQSVEQDRSQWQPVEKGQTICAGGLIFAHKLGCESRFLQAAQAEGWYNPEQLTEQDKVFDTVEDLAEANKDA